MLNVSIGAQIQTGLDRSRTRTTIEKAGRFIYIPSTHDWTKFLKIVKTVKIPIYFYTRLIWQSFVKGPTVEKAWKVSRNTTTCRNDKYRIKYTQHKVALAAKSCRLYGDDTTSDLTVLRNRHLQMLVEAFKRLEPEWLPSTNRAVHFHASSSLQTVRWTLLDEGD